MNPSQPSIAITTTIRIAIPMTGTNDQEQLPRRGFVQRLCSSAASAAAALVGSKVLFARVVTLALKTKRLETSQDSSVSSNVPKRSTARGPDSLDGRLDLCCRLRLARKEAMRLAVAWLVLVKPHQRRSRLRRQQAGQALPIGDIEVARGIQAEPRTHGPLANVFAAQARAPAWRRSSLAAAC